MKFLLLPFVYGIYGIFISITLLLDKIFYPNSSYQKLSKPIFLLGHPRSGTTFLHRYILKNCDELKGNNLWELIFPSITSRKIVRKLIPKINLRFLSKNLYKSHIHEASLLEAETDDAAIFLRYFNGLLPWLYLKIWKIDNQNLVEDLKINIIKDKYWKFLDSFYKKQTLVHNKRVMVKSFSYIVNLEKLLSKYPDAKIIILLRSPEQCVPSSMSLLKNMMSEIIDFSSIDENLKFNFYKKILSVSKYYYTEIDKIKKNYKTSDHVLFVDYSLLINDFKYQMIKIFEFLEINTTETIIKTLEEQSEKQKKFKSSHNYSLEEFGFTKDIFNDF